MSIYDRQHWDSIYSERANKPLPPPDPLLFPYTPPVTEDRVYRALDLAGGQGQNGLWLAAEGYVVDVVDISRVALMQGQAEMARRSLRTMNFRQLDLDENKLDFDEPYDLICVFRFLKRELFAALRTAIRPGGRIIYATYNIRHLAEHPEFRREFLLEPGELAGYFADWRILYNADDAALSELVAIKPG